MATKKSKVLKYSELQMEKAIEDVKRGVSHSVAAKNNNVPRSTLISKIKGYAPVERRMGPQSILTKEEETVLVQWIFTMANAGFPVSTDQLFDSVKRLLSDLKRDNPFTDGRPGRKWYIGFMKRNPQVANRMAQNLTMSRASVTENNVRDWFKEVHDYLKSQSIESFNENISDGFQTAKEISKETLDSILKDPSRIFNADESAFFLNPSGNKVLVKKGQKNVYQHINNDEKECITALLIGNAAGTVGPTMIVFRYARLPVDIAENAPSDWALGKSDNGWMTCELFYEYVSNVFHKWLNDNNIERPVILFIDGHTSHLSLPTSEFCSKNGIILVALLPNATHLLQPMDVAVFRTLKAAWKESVRNWRVNNMSTPILKKRDFAPLLKECVENRIKGDVLKNGFRKCGLYPWDANAVDYSKLMNTSSLSSLNSSTTSDSSVAEAHEQIETVKSTMDLEVGVTCLESYIGTEKLEQFKLSEDWQGTTEDASLFKVWKRMKNDLKEHVPSVPGHQDKKEACSSQHILLETELPVIEEGLYIINSNGFVVDLGLTDSDQTLQDIQCVERVGLENNCSSDDLSAIHVIEDEDAVRAILIESGIPDLDHKDSTTTVDDINNQKRLNQQSQHEMNEELPNMTDSEKTPLKQMQGASSSNNQKSIPSPFKRALFWPEPMKTNKRRQKHKLPSVATSADWISYYKKKQEEKLEEEQMKAERALKRKIKQEAGEKVCEKKAHKHKFKKNDYICMYCSASWNEEKNGNIKAAWIDCDKCKNSAHLECLPKTCLTKFNLNDASRISLSTVTSVQLHFLCAFCEDEST